MTHLNRLAVMTLITTAPVSQVPALCRALSHHLYRKPLIGAKILVSAGEIAGTVHAWCGMIANFPKASTFEDVPP
jgi:hypothetical protein